MIEYLSMLISIGAVAALSTFAFWGDAGDKTFRSILSLVVIYTAASPTLALVGEICKSDFEIGSYVEENIDITETEIYSAGEKAFREGVREYVSLQFDIEKENITVQVKNFDLEKMKAEKINIILSGKAIVKDAAAIESSVFNAGLGECEVDISVGAAA